MNTSIQFGPADRDDRGFVKAPAEPRSLADLLPTPAAVRADAARIVRQPPTKAEWASMIGLGVLLIALAAYLWSSGDARPAAPPRAAPTIPAAAPDAGDGALLPSPIPVAMRDAYAAPNQDATWQVEATRAITPTAHYGDEWIQADVAGSGRIWLRASDWPTLAIVGPDLSPRRVAPVVAAPIVPVAVEPPTPVPCAQVGITGKMVEVCGDGDLDVLARDKWIATYGGNVGVVKARDP